MCEMWVKCWWIFGELPIISAETHLNTNYWYLAWQYVKWLLACSRFKVVVDVWEKRQVREKQMGTDVPHFFSHSPSFLPQLPRVWKRLHDYWPSINGLLTQTNYPLTVNKQSVNVSTDMSDNTVFDLKSVRNVATDWVHYKMNKLTCLVWIRTNNK